MTADTLTGMLLLAGGGVLALALTQLMIRSSVTGVGILLAYIVADYAGAPDPSLTIGSVSVYGRDIVITVVLAAAVARFLRLRTVTWAQRALLAVAVLVGLSLARGVVAFGPTVAINEARNWIGLIAAALYCSTITPQAPLLRYLGRVVVIAGCMLMAVAVANWAALAAGISLPAAEGARGLRVLGAGATFVVAQAALLLAPAWALRGRRTDTARRLALALFGVVLLLQHRTVWIAFAVTLLVLMARNPALGRRVGAVVLVAGVGMTVVAVTALDTDATELSATAVDDQTFEWRAEGWQALLFEDGPQTPRDLLLGLPFGTGFERQVGNTVVVYSPHSFYVEGYLRLGLLGMVIVVGLYAGLLRNLLRRHSSGREYASFAPDNMVNLLIFQLIFGVAYFVPITAGVVLGLAAAVAANREVPAPLPPAAAVAPSADRRALVRAR